MKKSIQSLLSLLVLIFAILLTSNANGQQIKVFNVHNATLDECLKQIEKQTGYGYLFKGLDLKAVKGITYSAESVDLNVVLRSILANTGFSYELNNKVILIFKTIQKVEQSKQAPVPKATSVRVTIVDSLTKEPVIGASCLLKNYGIYGVADLEGIAVLKNVPSGEAAFEIQMLGYETYSATININSPLDIRIAIQPTSLQLEEVTVVAKASAAGTSTSSKIGRQAMDHLQATSLKDIMQLLPGQLITGVNDMTSAEKLTIRTLNSYSANNAFGTSILVDGIPVSDNASLKDKTAINSTGATGVDLRQIGADNIESVEVIRGIPSAEYGDLASGAVLVNTKSGYTPYEVRAKINPSNLNASFGKGWNLGKKKGNLNVNFDYVQAWGDPRQKSSSFDRVSGGVAYSKTFGKLWYTTTKININSLIDTRIEDPDIISEGTINSQKSLSLRISHNGKISVNAPLMRTLSYSLGYSESISESRNTTTVSAGGGLPVITALTPGYYEIPYLTNSYKASGGTIGRPRSLFAKVTNAFSAKINKLHQRFNMGVEYKWEENKARGFYNDDDNYPIRPNSNGRPRPYYDIPSLNQISAFVEDNIELKFSEQLNFKIQAGIRFNMMQPGIAEQVSSFSPRINASLNLLNWLEIRGGWGLNSKTPGLSHLYPEPNYSDRESVRYLPTTIANQLVIYNTNIIYVQRNNDLKNATNTRSELGFDIALPNNMKFSIVGYNDFMPNGFGNFTEYITYNSNYYTANKGLIIIPGQKPIVDWNNPARVDTVFTTTGRTGNTQANLDRGVEFDFDFGHIKSIRTSFYLSGAYMETQSWDNGRDFSSPTGIAPSSVYGQGGSNTPPFKLEYPSGRSKSIQRRFSNVLRVVTNIPKMKMVASITGQIIWYNYSKTTNQKVDPIGWIDTDLSYHKITSEMLSDPEYRIKGILLSDQRKNPTTPEAITQPPIWIIMARLSKDISKSLGFSFFVNNAFFYTPYQSSSNSGTLTERNTGTFSFGMELFIKI
ncbi:MAG: TonB-dependent receptor plug domain-containing protein [Bacteroidales bacterium]|jgi:hypothetical protein